MLDYFSPAGVPLRSKLSITITEQHLRYQVNADEMASRRRPPRIGDAIALAASNNLDSLFDLSPTGGFGFSQELDLDLGASVGASVSAQAGLGADLGLNADLSFSANAGIDLDPQSALEVFGEAVLQAGLPAGAGFALAPRGSVRAGAVLSGGLAPPGPWAPGGPPPGTRGAEFAARVNAARASGGVDLSTPRFAGEFSATALQARPTDLSAPASVGPLPGAVGQVVASAPAGRVELGSPVVPMPVRGSPPLNPTRFGPVPPAGVFSREPGHGFAVPAGESPAWERLPSEK